MQKCSNFAISLALPFFSPWLLRSCCYCSFHPLQVFPRFPSVLLLTACQVNERSGTRGIGILAENSTQQNLYSVEDPLLNARKCTKFNLYFHAKRRMHKNRFPWQWRVCRFRSMMATTRALISFGWYAKFVFTAKIFCTQLCEFIRPSIDLINICFA